MRIVKRAAVFQELDEAAWTKSEEEILRSRVKW